MAANKKRVMLPTTMARAGWDVMNARDDIETIAYAPNMPTPEFRAMLHDVDGISLSLTRFGEPELDVAPRMRVTARIGVGFDTVDVPELTKRGIPLMTVGIANSTSVAEQAFSMMFALAKRTAQGDAAVRTGTWRDQLKAFPVDLMDKNLLVIGFGRIGTRVVKRALAFDMRVRVYDPYVDPAQITTAGAEPVRDLDAAVAEADFISVHCPKNRETIDLFDAKRLARMKRAAFIVNTARGGIVNEPALYDALASNAIAGAGIDVFDIEPASLDHPFLKLSNIVLAPHLAGGSVEAMERMAIVAARNILSVLDGNPLRENAVNPEVFGPA